MISFPNAKINLGLNIIEKRPDGYHNISSGFYPISWSDILEIVPSAHLNFQASGIEIPQDDKGNLCLRAYHLLNEKYKIPPVDIHLHKIIPIGAGLGGGSADGAFTLKMLNELFGLQIGSEELEELAGKLGSDCPFFIKNKPVLASETGTSFSELPEIGLSGKWIVLVYPNLHISTQEAYSGISPQRPAMECQEVLKGGFGLWKDYLKNDFEQSLFSKYAVLAEIKQQLYEKGAFYASMTGSGSTLYGIFEHEVDTSDWEEFQVFQGKLT